MSDSLITTLCDLIVTRLQAQTELSGVSILNQSSLQIIDDAQKALAGLGLVAVVTVDSVVFEPSYKSGSEHRAPSQFAVAVLVTENLFTNRANASGRQLPSCECAEYIAAALLDFVPGETWDKFHVTGIQQIEAGADELRWSVEAVARTRIAAA